MHRLLQKLEHVNMKAVDRPALQSMIRNAKNIIYWTHQCQQIDMTDLEIMTLVIEVRHYAMQCQRDALMALAKISTHSVIEPFKVGYIDCATTNYEKLMQHTSMLIANVDPSSQAALEQAM